MVIKFNQEGRVVMTLGRKPEAVPVPAPAHQASSGRGGAPTGAGVAGDTFNRPTDVAWDAAGNIFVSDGYGNSRVVKCDKNGKFIKSWGSRGTAPGQFNTPHSIATDAAGNVYVGDRENKRLQVFDNDGTFKAQYTNVGAPWAVCDLQGRTNIFTARTRTEQDRWTTVKSTRWSWTERYWASSDAGVSC